MCRFEAHGLVLASGTQFDEKGNKYETIAPAVHAADQNAKAARKNLNEMYGKTPFVLGWHEIRLLLFQSLPEGVVSFDKQVSLAWLQ